MQLSIPEPSRLILILQQECLVCDGQNSRDHKNVWSEYKWLEFQNWDALFMSLYRRLEATKFWSNDGNCDQVENFELPDDITSHHDKQSITNQQSAHLLQWLYIIQGQPYGLDVTIFLIGAHDVEKHILSSSWAAKWNMWISKNFVHAINLRFVVFSLSANYLIC